MLSADSLAVKPIFDFASSGRLRPKSIGTPNKSASEREYWAFVSRRRVVPACCWRALVARSIDWVIHSTIARRSLSSGCES